MRVQFDLQIKVSMKNTTNSDAEVGWGRIPITTLPGAGRGELTSKKGRRAICNSPLTHSNPSAKKGLGEARPFLRARRPELMVTKSVTRILALPKRQSFLTTALMVRQGPFLWARRPELMVTKT